MNHVSTPIGASVGVMIAGESSQLVMDKYREKLEAKPGDCGIDLIPTIEDYTDIHWHDLGFYRTVSIPTRSNLLIPAGYFAWVVGRSSSPDKLMGCQVISGIIDAGYTGEYRVRVQLPPRREDQIGNKLEEQFIHAIMVLAHSKTALAQAIIIPFRRATFVWVNELPKTERGQQGYGSTDECHTVTTIKAIGQT